MVQNISVENNFTGGFKTEFTGLNFPENACTAADNCIFTLIGDVLSRQGIDFEANYVYTGINRSNQAISTYKWNNVGGDGLTQMIVVQVGDFLYFFKSSAAITTSPLSTTLINTNINFTIFQAIGSTADASATECQFADGNGFLFVFHPNCDPFYCNYNPASSSITASKINLQIREFTGIYPEPGNPSITFRPTTLSAEHQYNLQNQGWTDTVGWGATSTDTGHMTVSGSSSSITTGIQSWTVQGGLSISINDPVSIGVTAVIIWSNGGVVYSANVNYTGTGIVTNYTGTTLTINVTSSSNVSEAGSIVGVTSNAWTFSKDASVTNTIGVWHSALGNYPSNADIWFSFKDTSNVFNPSVTAGQVALSTTPAPTGHYIVPAFNQDKSLASGIAGITPVVTSVRPRTGSWFQGRVFYAGVDSSQTATGDEPFYTWTENIYFSQIITDITQAGYCYQTNDPTDETLFDLLPSDGGVITIQGSGSIFKIFPVQNGVLVFAANGIWFITGRQGIGFTANDYTVTKISGVQSISSTSFVNVLGYPVFWNEEGIYTVSPGQTGSLSVENLCLGTILTYYQSIPLQSKKFARGDYSPVDFQIQWCFKSTNETSFTDRYQFDSILILNTANKAFYPYTLTGTPFIHDIRYVAGPGGSASPDPTFKYLTSVKTISSYNFTFSEERDSTNFVDWFSFDGVGVPYLATFTTGYKLRGQAMRKWGAIYANILSRVSEASGYVISGVWDYSTVRISTPQTVRNAPSRDLMRFRRHKLRGHGYSLQIQISSIPGMPFEIMGWSVLENIDQGI